MLRGDGRGSGDYILPNLSGSEWASKRLSWCIEQWDLTNDLSRNAQVDAIQKSFQVQNYIHVPQISWPTWTRTIIEISINSVLYSCNTAFLLDRIYSISYPVAVLYRRGLMSPNLSLHKKQIAARLTYKSNLQPVRLSNHSVQNLFL